MDPRIVAEVKERFSQVMGIEGQDLDLDARLDDVYGVTSVNQMRLVSELEISLGIEIPEAEGKAACSLAALVRLCEQYAPAEAEAGEKVAAAGRG